MKKAFTLIEVVILLVIFILVALLVIPLSIDDTIQARNVSKWKQVQSDSQEIPMHINTFSENNSNEIDLQTFVAALVKVHPLNKVVTYNVKFLNGDKSSADYTFSEKFITDNSGTLAFNWFKSPHYDKKTKRYIFGVIMYDVNGKQKPNVWGKDVFGMNIFKDAIEPFGKYHDADEIEFDCSRHGTGLYCSSYYLNGGNF